MPNSTTDISDIVKETLDARIHSSYMHNDSTLTKIKRTVPTEGITGRGRNFAIKVGSNESYGSIAEGGNFPSAVDINYLTATVNYRRQFSSFDFTGDVEDLATNKTLRNALTEIVDDTMSSFDEKQNFFLFRDGSGVIATATGAISGETLPFATSVSNPDGARMLRAGQLLSCQDATASYADIGDLTVVSVNRSTDVATFTTGQLAALSATATTNDALAFRDSYDLAPQGFDYSINSGDSDWYGLDRSVNLSLGAVVKSAASASINYDTVEAALLLSRNARGDNAPKFDYMLVGHPVIHRDLRSLARSAGNVQYNANISGVPKADLMVQDVGLAGMQLHEDSWCPPSNMYGIKTDTWAIEEVAPRQLYKHADGQIFVQSLGAATTYKDAKEGRVYWRYNFVCKEPYKNFKISNINFTAADVIIQRS